MVAVQGGFLHLLLGAFVKSGDCVISRIVEDLNSEVLALTSGAIAVVTLTGKRRFGPRHHVMCTSPGVAEPGLAPAQRFTLESIQKGSETLFELAYHLVIVARSVIFPTQPMTVPAAKQAMPGSLPWRILVRFANLFLHR